MCLPMKKESVKKKKVRSRIKPRIVEGILVSTLTQMTCRLRIFSSHFSGLLCCPSLFLKPRYVSMFVSILTNANKSVYLNYLTVFPKLLCWKDVLNIYIKQVRYNTKSTNGSHSFANTIMPSPICSLQLQYAEVQN